MVTFYRVALVLHLSTAVVWLGHMFFWSLFAGPALKKVIPRETAIRLRSASMRLGGLGWPALFVLAASGVYLLSVRGLGFGAIASGQALDTAFGRAMMTKLLLVAGMVAYQAVIGHRRAPRAIYLNMMMAAVILAISIGLIGG